MALTFTATGATPYHYRPATSNETLPRLVLRVVIDGIATDAMLDTGGGIFVMSSHRGQAVGFGTRRGT